MYGYTYYKPPQTRSIATIESTSSLMVIPGENFTAKVLPGFVGVSFFSSALELEFVEELPVLLLKFNEVLYMVLCWFFERLERFFLRLPESIFHQKITAQSYRLRNLILFIQRNRLSYSFHISQATIQQVLCNCTPLREQ